MRRRIRRAVLAALALAFATSAASAFAQAYPNRPIRIVMGFVPGSVLDLMTRMFTPKLGEALGQPVVVENRPGAGGNIATELVARAAPDGHTLLMGGIVNAINVSLVKSAPFDFAKEFTPVVPTATVPNLLVAHPSLPVTNVRELIAYAKERPGQLSHGSSGNGTSPHLAGEMLNMVTGTKIVHVPYKSSPQAMTDLLAGRIQLSFSPPSTALPHLKSGALRALASTGAARSSALPDLPTMIEAGVPDFSVELWMGMFAPAATPRAIVERINRELGKILESAELRAQFTAQAMEPMRGTPDEFAAFVRAEIDKWAKVVRESGARID